MLTLLLFLVVPATSASADYFGTNCPDGNTPCRADDANMDFCTPHAWSSTWGNPFTDAMANLDLQTVMYDTYQPVCGPQTDIGGYLNSGDGIVLNSSTRGRYACTKPLYGWGWGKCDQASIYVNTYLLTSYELRRKTFCHEVGHAIGLYHGNDAGNGCMVTTSGATFSFYTSHQVNDHINPEYD
ncbi:hypothetical protein [Cryobacterium zongtaii]|uniref:hypothetical protein n=1 Tax=Cryobacterium zongtaii TaxID=1259217 RepID=UPI001057144E|nr:hypothetical protein [Cryobacterium zongtaii]